MQYCSYEYTKMYVYSTKALPFFTDLLSGIHVLYNNLWLPKYTIQYPHEKGMLTTRFRGEHVLRRYLNGEERCIACKLCEIICPAQAISIVSGIFQNARRRAITYDLDLVKCIYCGLCQEACPVDAIVESNTFEFVVYRRIALQYTKFQLLENGIRFAAELELQMSIEYRYR